MTGSGGRDRSSRTPVVDRRAFLRVAGGSGVGAFAGLGGVPTAGATGGDERWHFETGDAVASSPTVVDGSVFVGSDDGNVYALDAESGDERWRAATDEAVFSSPTVVDDTVYVGSNDNYLHAFDAATGDRAWRFRTSHDVTASPTVADGTVVVGSHDASVYGVDAATGEERWSFPTGGLVFASPTVHDVSGGAGGSSDSSDGAIAYVGSWDTYLYAIDLATGDERWSFDVNGQVYSSPTVADGTVYVGTHGNSIYALDAATGEGQWRADAADSVLPSPTVHDGTVYVGSWDHRVYALDADSGEPQWRFDAGSRVGSSPTVADGTVFVGTAGGALLAIDAETGEQRWRFATGGTVDSSPIVVDGTVYVGCADGNVYAVDAGVDGDSEGSRVESGTLGHHHSFAGEGASDGSSGGEVSIENLRLVQTVENTRAIDSDGPLDGSGDLAPVADDLVYDETDERIDWTATKPPLVDGRRLAPAFDIELSNSRDITEPLTLTGRLVHDDETILEHQATLPPSALQGQDYDRRRELELVYGLNDIDRLPLFEMLALNPDLVDGDYPTFPTASEHDVEIELGGPAAEAPVTERVAMDSRDVVSMGSLTIGFIGLEKGAITDAGSYRFDDSPDIVGFAEESAQELLNLYPLTEVTVAAIESPVVGASANGDRWAMQRAANIADRKMTARIDEAETFRLRDDGRRVEDVDVSAVDVAVAVLPEDDFFGGIRVDDGTKGYMPISWGQPEASAVLAEIADTRTPAHEIAHYLLWYYYDDPPVKSDDGPQHASHQLRSTGFVHREGDLEVLPAQHSFMIGSAAGWMDAYTYTGLVEGDLEPREPPERQTPPYMLGFAARTDEDLANVDRTVDSADDRALEATEVDIVGIRDALDEIRGSLAGRFEDVEHYWERPDALSRSSWRQLAELGPQVEAAGEAIAAAETRYLTDADITTSALGERLRRTGRSLTDRAETRLEADVQTVLEILGRPGPELELTYETLPVVGTPESLSGDGRIEVSDDTGTVLASNGLTTIESGLAKDGDDSEELENAVAGVVPLPAAATNVSVTAQTDAGSVSTSMNPTTDPIRDALESLPDRAFDGDLARSDAIDRLDRIGDIAADGDHDGAAEAIESLYRDLLDAIPDDYTPESAGEPTKDRVLALVGQQLQRFGGEVPEFSSDADELPRTWLAAGAGGALLGTYALKRAWDRRDDRSAGE